MGLSQKKRGVRGPVEKAIILFHNGPHLSRLDQFRAACFPQWMSRQPTKPEKLVVGLLGTRSTVLLDAGQAGLRRRPMVWSMLRVRQSGHRPSRRQHAASPACVLLTTFPGCRPPWPVAATPTRQQATDHEDDTIAFHMLHAVRPSFHRFQSRFVSNLRFPHTATGPGARQHAFLVPPPCQSPAATS